MLFPTAALVLAAGALVAAQTPAGFTPEVTARLDLVFGAKTVTVPGTSLTKAETAKQPTIGTTDAVLNGTYLWMMIDQDVPANFQNPSAGGRRTNLHAMLTGFKASSSGGGDVGAVHALASSATGPVAYTGPAPPAETPAHPHRYVSLLYETPAAGFAVTRAQVGQTLGFNLATFVAAVGLGAPVRANYFNVTG
ncbi:phosphatidylethanolamine-binding protein [Lasiosphaeria miniovina]|uniref:Phosphatidylethanolamine-binding protein n=1 Tax=Lasiosphaeria miniovina TaxID=1954250 RepID=A0AA40B4Y2_9PEZI|nr:phosphatidylethanolamine-binding protein [Lasiosphaeria miniovina]KAK0727796.1 phosphatidylethanolamine-binding protein [Lasiosphaeria miniovina]